jgi:hypothetical protein
MTKRTRLFLTAATGILVLGLGTGAVASYMGFQNFVVIGGNGPAELAYVPRDARMVAYADVHDIVNSELRQKIRQMQGSSPDSSRKFEETTGIDPERDVDHVLAFSTAQGPAPQGAPPVLLARGRFDVVRIEGLVREHGGVAEDYKGIRLVTDTAHKTTVGFIEPGLVAVGGTEAIKAAIDTKRSGVATVRDNGDLMKLLKKVDDGNAWAVSRFDGLPVGTPFPADVVKQLPAISWLAVSGHIDGGVHGTVRAEARDEAAAKDLQDVLRGFLALARLQAGQRAEFADVINSLEMSGEGKTVVLEFAVPDKAIAAMSSLRAQRRRDAPEPGAPQPPAPPARPSQPRTPAAS